MNVYESEVVTVKLIRKIAALTGIICALAMFSACQGQTAVPTELTTNTGAELGLLYYTKTDNEIALTGFEYGSIALEIPAQIDGKDVVKIGDNAFLSNDLLTEIVLPESVKAVGIKAFSGCGRLKAVRSKGDPGSIEADKSAFDGSPVSYIDDNTPDPDTYFCGGEFLYTENEGELTITGFIPRISIELPDEIDGCPVTELGTNLFLNKSSISEIDLPKHIRTISSAAFQGCDGLESVVVPETLVEIGDHAFYNCKNLQRISVSGREGQTGYADLTYINTVDEWAFSGCESLVSAGISNSMTGIGTGAFSRCVSLTQLDIPAGVSRIGISAFDDCSSMQSINVSEDNSIYCDIDGVLFNKARTEILKYPEGRDGEYIVPLTVKTIGEYALKNCENPVVSDSVTAVRLGGLSCTGSSSAFLYLPDSIVYAEGAVCTGRTSVYFCGKNYNGNESYLHRSLNSPPFARQ